MNESSEEEAGPPIPESEEDIDDLPSWFDLIGDVPPRQPDPEIGRRKYGARAKPCDNCGKPPDQLEWAYFQSAGITWQLLAGRAGWMTTCPVCKRQVDFFIEIVN